MSERTPDDFDEAIAAMEGATAHEYLDDIARERRRAEMRARLEALAKLEPLDYEVQRKIVADELKCRVTTIDRLIRKLRANGHADQIPGAGAEFSDDTLALRFADKHSAQLRWVDGFGSWFMWDTNRWARTETLEAFDLSRAICREAAASVLSRKNDQSLATALSSAKTVAAVERLAKADRRLAAIVDQWDRDPWLINTPAGVMDLHTGEMRPHQPDDYLTKITAVAPADAGTPSPPLWTAFLYRIFDDDEDQIAFLRRVGGYCLTGSIREHGIFFAYGSGANGKSVCLNTLRGVLGDYATSAPMETFTANPGDRHPTELADLRGARLVTASETEEGRRWAESRIKQLSGGDPIKARFMRQDFFEYLPQFKLFLSGNHKPGLRGVDEAIRRRLYLIPFMVTIPAEERDPELPEKLRFEWPGILRWLIDGCLEWQAVGLKPPDAVRSATEEYMSAEDSIALWISENCETGPNRTATTAILFANWKAYAERTGEYAGSQKRFSQSLAQRGFQKWRCPQTDRGGFAGIRLKPEDTPAPSGYWNE